MRELVKNRMGARLLKLVDELAVAYGTGTGVGIGLMGTGVGGQTRGHDVFPQRAGSHLHMDNPALEFVKAVCHVLALDPSLSQEVASLRRLLLAQLRVREFSATSEYKDPSLSYILRDVICSYCSTCRDVDLLRDPSVTQPDPTQRWLCTHCLNALDQQEIEHRLIEEAQRQSTAFLLQDSRCPVTKAVSTRQCASTSALCQPLQMDVPVATLRGNLHLLLRVAQYHGYSWLQSTLEELLG